MTKFNVLCDVRGADGEVILQQGATVDRSESKTTAEGKETARLVKRRVLEKAAPATKKASKSTTKAGS